MFVYRRRSVEIDSFEESLCRYNAQCFKRGGYLDYGIEKESLVVSVGSVLPERRGVLYVASTEKND